MVCYHRIQIIGNYPMRYRTKPIQLEAIKYDGKTIPDFARGRALPQAGEPSLKVDTDEGERICRDGDYFVFTDNGQLLVRGGAIFEAIFEPLRRLHLLNDLLSRLPTDRHYGSAKLPF